MPATAQITRVSIMVLVHIFIAFSEIMRLYVKNDPPSIMITYETASHMTGLDSKEKILDASMKAQKNRTMENSGEKLIVLLRWISLHKYDRQVSDIIRTSPMRKTPAKCKNGIAVIVRITPDSGFTNITNKPIMQKSAMGRYHGSKK